MASLIYQIKQALDAQKCIGDSRHEAKLLVKSHTPEGIFSYGAYRTYYNQGCHFARWVKKTHGCNTLEKAKEYVEEYLQENIDRGLSPYTLSTRRAALCKIYQCKACHWNIVLPERNRSNIKRSRGTVLRDRGFSEKNNAVIVAFCKGTGLRRHELAKMKPVNVREAWGRLYLVDVAGKGGKTRTVEVLEKYQQDVYNAIRGKEEEELLFPRIPSHMDVHGYRREYAQTLYDSLARPVERIAKKERYICRSDKKGFVYDKVAMLYVSRQLGHNRISIIAGHYLH